MEVEHHDLYSFNFKKMLFFKKFLTFNTFLLECFHICMEQSLINCLNVGVLISCLSVYHRS